MNKKFCKCCKCKKKVQIEDFIEDHGVCVSCYRKFNLKPTKCLHCGKKLKKDDSSLCLSCSLDDASEMAEEVASKIRLEKCTKCGTKLTKEDSQALCAPCIEKLWPDPRVRPCLSCFMEPSDQSGVYCSSCNLKIEAQYKYRVIEERLKKIKIKLNRLTESQLYDLIFLMGVCSGEGDEVPTLPETKEGLVSFLLKYFMYLQLKSINEYFTELKRTESISKKIKDKLNKLSFEQLQELAIEVYPDNLNLISSHMILESELILIISSKPESKITKALKNLMNRNENKNTYNTQTIVK